MYSRDREFGHVARKLFVFLFVHQRISFRIRSQCMTKDLVGAQRLWILTRIEQGLVVFCPDHVPGDVRNLVR